MTLPPHLAHALDLIGVRNPPKPRPTPAPSPDDLVRAALPKGKWCDCGLPHETGGPCWECRTAATDPATVAAIIERAGK